MLGSGVIASPQERRLMYLKAGIVGLLMCISTVAHAKMQRVAVIDSGYNGKRANICKWGSYDFTTGEFGVGKDVIPHGTNVTNTIATGNKDYCIMVLKIFHNGHNYINYIPAAVYRAVNEGATVINMSLEGQKFDKQEYEAISYAVSKGVKVFVASGNDSQNLDLMCDIYPACYRIPGVVVVGTYEKHTKGNEGSVVTQQEAWCSEGLCGTSLSTAIATQKYLKGLK